MNERTEQPDPFLDYDAAYVMGALDPQDRREFEAHLAGCARCSAAVAELAGMPGLLAQVPTEQMLAPRTAPEPVPDTLLPRMVAAVRQQRRRRLVLNSVAALTAAACLVLGVLLISGGPSSAPSPAAAPQGTLLAMSAVKPSSVTADLWLDPVAWGTRVDIKCNYRDSTPPPVGGVDRWVYRLVIIPRDGGATQQVAQWTALPNKTVALTGSTNLKPAEIADIQLQNSRGVALLHAAPRA
jgi:hypothetical protein